MTEHTIDHQDEADRGARSRPGLTRLLVLAAVASVLALAVLFATVGGDGRSGSTRPGALAVPLTAADGATTNLGELGGQPLVVNFFASWCPPCRAEMPDLERVHQQVGDRVRFVGVNVDYDETTWKSFVAESGITYDTVFEPRQDLLRALGGAGMPTTVLLTEDGKIAHLHTGILDDEALLRLIDERLPA